MPSPVERVVILVKENHGFDTYFGRFPGVDGDATLAHADNPPTVDPAHTHEAWLNRTQGAVREQYLETDIPSYWSWARKYTLCDRYFTDVAGPSTPNHMMLIAGDSPWVDNPHGGYRVTPAQQIDIPSLPAQLEGAGLMWGNYGGYAFDYVKALAHRKRPVSQFVADARTGKLPTVSWVYADHMYSEHPPDSATDRAHGVGDVTAGSAWTSAQIDAIVAGDLWDSTAIFVTWDDWGGWADHVDPPKVETWNDDTQFRYGGRVPCLVLGAYARAGYVSHVEHSHVSLLHFCAKTFGLPPVTQRVADADDMADCFDYSHKQPPPTPSPRGLLAQIHDAAERAAARLETAAAHTTDGTARAQLHYAAEDVDRIRRLSSPTIAPPGRLPTA